MSLMQYDKYLREDLLLILDIILIGFIKKNNKKTTNQALNLNINNYTFSNMRCGNKQISLRMKNFCDTLNAVYIQQIKEQKSIYSLWVD